MTNQDKRPYLLHYTTKNVLYGKKQITYWAIKYLESSWLKILPRLFWFLSRPLRQTKTARLRLIRLSDSV